MPIFYFTQCVSMYILWSLTVYLAGIAFYNVDQNLEDTFSHCQGTLTEGEGKTVLVL
jgi:hypothetical protein